MSRKKLREQRTETDNLISNLRGEVGEIIITWVLMKDLLAEIDKSESTDIIADLKDPRLARLKILVTKLRAEIVSRLSELAEKKIGRLNFYFAGKKINKLSKDIDDYGKFIKKNRFKKKRNYEISHKELPEKWKDHKFVDIPYKKIVKGIVKALQLIKKIDDIFLGPCAKYLWRKMRKHRYKPMSPANVSYMIMSYFRLSKNDRVKIINEEVKKGENVWESINAVVNGQKRKIMACKKWGAIIVENKVIILDQYPLIDIKNIEIS